MKLAHKATANGVLSVTEFAVRSLIALFITPLLVSGLGPALFGVWKVIERFMSYMLVADGRVTQGLQSFLSHNQEKADDEQKRKAVKNAAAIWISFLPIGITVGSAFVYFAPSLIHELPEHADDIRVTAAILVVMLLLSGFSAIPIACLVGTNRAYVKFIPSIVSCLVAGVLMVVSIKVGLGIWGLAAAQFVGTASLAVLVIWAASKSIAWFGWMRPSWTGAFGFLKFNAWYGAWTLINKVILTSDIVLLGYLLSMTSVSMYVITGFSAQLLATVAALLISACVPGFGAVLGSEQFDRAAKMKRELSDYSWFFIGAICAIYLACNQHFVKIWVGEPLYAGRAVEVLFLILTVQIIFIRSHAFIIDITLDVRSKVYVGALSAALSVGLALYLVPLHGIVGLCLSFMVGRMPMTVVFPVIVSRKLHMSGSNTGLLARRLVSLIALFLLGHVLSSAHSPDGWAGLMTMVFFASILIVPSAFILMMGQMGREAFCKRLYSLYVGAKIRLRRNAS